MALQSQNPALESNRVHTRCALSFLHVCSDISASGMRVCFCVIGSGQREYLLCV